MSNHAAQQSVQFLPKSNLGDLLAELIASGYQVFGPRLQDDVILFSPIHSIDELPRGVRDEQSPGSYRIHPHELSMFFDYVTGPSGPKKCLFPPELRLFQMHVEQDRFELDQEMPRPPKMALLGVRPCEIAAIGKLDRVFSIDRPAGTFRCEMDDYYSRARAQLFIVAVNCTSPGETCFCTSMGTGPRATTGFDLALTEQRSGFVLESGTPDGAALAARLPLREPTEAELELNELRLQAAPDRIKREVNVDQLPEILEHSAEHPYWDEVATRCLGCGNCTLVCPTCFCSSMSDSSDLTNTHAQRTRKWDVCFTQQYSYTTAGPVRATIRARYRHWLRHKFSTWRDQFGTLGCVGCGRCITWCPVGIDLTQELRALRQALVNDVKRDQARKEVV